MFKGVLKIDIKCPVCKIEESYSIDVYENEDRSALFYNDEIFCFSCP